MPSYTLFLLFLKNTLSLIQKHYTEMQTAARCDSKQIQNWFICSVTLKKKKRRSFWVKIAMPEAAASVSTICWCEAPKGSQVCRLTWGGDVWWWDLLLGENVSDCDILHQNLLLWRHLWKKAKWETFGLSSGALVKLNVKKAVKVI